MSAANYPMKERLPPNRAGSFDRQLCQEATSADLDIGIIDAFLARVRIVDASALPGRGTSRELLAHLGLLVNGSPTNAAVLLFGRKPQRFVSSSRVKCTHRVGEERSVQRRRRTYSGTVFELVDQAVDYVMTGMTLAMGDAEGGIALALPGSGIPREVVKEAMVNAIAHRDYWDDRAIEVTLFADRVEIWNAGVLAPSMTIEMLRRPHDSIPRSPVLARMLYLAGYTARMGTGTRDMIMTCRGIGLPVPQFALRDGFVTELWWG